VLMYLDTSSREQLVLSLLAWAVFIGLYLITKWRGGSIDADVDANIPDIAIEGSGRNTTRVLVLANETVGADELLGELRDVDEKDAVEYFLCVPAAPAETGQDGRDGGRAAWEADVRAARTRLDATLDKLHAEGYAAEGQLADSRPFQAVQAASASFHPDRIVISTLPESRSRWLGEDLIGHARSASDVPVRHVVSTIPPTSVSAS
jgi:GABA permease